MLSTFALGPISVHWEGWSIQKIGLNVLPTEPTLIHDVASGAVGLDEAYFEWCESNDFRKRVSVAGEAGTEEIAEARRRVEGFVAEIHNQCEFTTPPLYIPEVLRFFAGCPNLVH